jgi:hypothetical protein
VCKHGPMDHILICPHSRDSRLAFYPAWQDKSGPGIRAFALVLTRLLVPLSYGESSVSVMGAVPDALPEAALSIGVPEDAFAAPERVTPGSSVPASPNRADGEVTAQDSVSGRHVRVVDWGVVALVVWPAGLAVVGQFLLITHLRFSARLESDRRKAGISGYLLPVYVSGMVETPCAFGLLHPAICVTQEGRENERTLPNAWT